MLDPLLDANQPPAPAEIRHALLTLDHAAKDYVTNAPLESPRETCHNVHCAAASVPLATQTGSQVGQSDEVTRERLTSVGDD